MRERLGLKCRKIEKALAAIVARKVRLLVSVSSANARARTTRIEHDALHVAEGWFAAVNFQEVLVHDGHALTSTHEIHGLLQELASPFVNVECYDHGTAACGTSFFAAAPMALGRTLVPGAFRGRGVQ
jgi:hypothetical protein